MEVRKIDETHISVTATQKQWAQLNKLIAWIDSEKGSMDNVVSMLEPDEVKTSLREWGETSMNAIQK